MCFQASARRPQAGDRNWCRAANQISGEPAPDRPFPCQILIRVNTKSWRDHDLRLVKIAHFPCLARDLPFDDVGQLPSAGRRAQVRLVRSHTEDAFGARSRPLRYPIRKLVLFRPSGASSFPTFAASRLESAYATSMASSTKPLSDSSEPVSSNELVIAAFPFSMLVMT